MKKRMLKIFSLILAVLSLNFLPAYAFGATKVIATDNNSDFAIETAEMVEKYDARVNKTQANSSGIKLRIIGRAASDSVNFKELGASVCIVNKDGRFVLQFENETLLKKSLVSLNGNPEIIYAEQDRLIYTSSEESTGEALSWGTSALGIDEYSQHINSLQPEESVTVAIVDSGVAKIDFVSDKLVDGYDFVDNDSDGTNDTNVDSHGTFLASIIADCTKNTPVNIMPVRVLASKTGSLANAVNGVYYAVDNGADVVNISLGAALSSCKSLDDALLYADGKNVSVVVCSGNTKSDITNYCPAHNESAITVSSVDKSLVFSESFSNYGNAVDVCAPGVDILGYSADGTQQTMSGTSMSAAYISAGVALFRLQYPKCNTSQVQTAIKNSCVDLGESGFDKYYGCGIPEFDKFIFDETVYVENISFSQTDVVILLGESQSVIPEISPINATDKTFKWEIDNPETASVNENGLITAKKTGTAVLTAKTNDGAYTASLNIVVKPQPVVEISVVNPPSKDTYIYKSSEEPDLTGIKLKAVRADGTTEIVENTELIDVYGFDTSSVGEKAVTLEFEECKTEITVTVEYAWWQWIIRILLLGFLWY